MHDFSFMRGDLDFHRLDTDEELSEFNSPYKLALFLLITEIEKSQQIGDGFDVDVHAFLGVFMSFLIRQKHLSSTALKCFVLRFVEPIAPSLVETFFKSLRIHHQLGVVLCTEVLFAQNRNPNFVWPKSIIGMFARKVQEAFSRRDLLGQDDLHKYLDTPPMEEELSRLSKNWRFDVETLSRKISEIEEKFSDFVC